MELTKKKAKENLSKLLEQFKPELETGRIWERKEEAVFNQFILKLLTEVWGWNFNNPDEVIPKPHQRGGIPDYVLNVFGEIKICFEHKPVRENLQKHFEQAIRYGYGEAPIVILTNFKEFIVFDCSIKPDIRNPRKIIKIDTNWEEYLERFDELWIFSKESVIAKKLDDFINIPPKNQIPIDIAILDDLKKWRDKLAKEIFKNNSDLFHSGDTEKDADYLKEITQKILDRIIFMRSCEDRNLSFWPSLKEKFEEREETSTITMSFLRDQFRHYLITFNSDLFRTQEWENKLFIDLKTMRDIISETYNPYQFDAIPIEVLGRIYEQYLGYTLRLTDHQVRFELKPDVRKAGGVYYTPKYVVDYIVKNTVGKLLKELSPRRAKKIKILDPACGSGSFLIRAYEEMLVYYQGLKKRKPAKKSNQEELDISFRENDPRLTINEKRQILLNHIFGVDIDEQSVEITKLSLMLKMIEGELFVSGRSILPMLDRNIRCGNSLISGSSIELKKYFGDEWYREKPFDWDSEFKDITNEGGFDIVIGNPPYGAHFSKKEKELLEILYKNTYEYQPNSFSFFIEKATILLRKSGYVSYIIPSVFITQYYFMNLRKYILDNCEMQNILLLNYKVFQGADTGDTAIFIFSKARDNTEKSVIKYAKASKEKDISSAKYMPIKQSEFRKNLRFEFIFSLNKEILEKIKSESIILGKIANCVMGIKPYQTGKGKPPQNEEIVKKRIFDSSYPKSGLYKKYLTGKDFDRYIVKPQEARYIKYGNWLAEPRYGAPFEREKIIVRQTSDIIRAVIEKDKYYNLNNVYNIEILDKNIDCKYLLGVLNSKLMVYVYQIIVPEKGRLFAEIKKANLDQLPIRIANISNHNEKILYDNLILSVDVMLDLNKKIQITKGENKEKIKRQIDKTDEEINNLVYDLYGLTAKERQIVEDSFKEKEAGKG